MSKSKQNLLIEHTDRKLLQLKSFGKITPPRKGWVNAVRTALGMSLRQLGNRLNISPPSVQEIEQREVSGSITIKLLSEVANALNLQLVYGFIPKGESLEAMIEKRAKEKAREIVMRSSQTMKLEDQENSKSRLEKAIASKSEEIKRTLPNYLWD